MQHLEVLHFLQKRAIIIIAVETSPMLLIPQRSIKLIIPIPLPEKSRMLSNTETVAQGRKSILHIMMATPVFAVPVKTILMAIRMTYTRIIYSIIVEEQ